MPTRERRILVWLLPVVQLGGEWADGRSQAMLAGGRPVRMGLRKDGQRGRAARTGSKESGCKNS